MSLFKRTKPEVPDGPLAVGTYFSTEDGYFYVAAPNKRYRLISKRVLDSWAPHRVVEVSEQHAAVQNMVLGPKMAFRNGSLIWDITDGRIYLIELGKRRLVTSPDAYLRLGVDYNRLRDYTVAVSREEVNLHEQGEDFN